MDFGVVGRAAATVFVVVEFGGGATAGETEAARFEHCDGFEAVAIAGIAKGRRMGDALFAVIVLKSDTEVTEEELVAHCRTLIGGYKIPRQYTFVDTLPKNALGKILKTTLRRQYS